MTTTPDSGPSQWLSTAFAIGAEPLPTPMTTVRPLGRGGRLAAITFAGSAAVTAASKSEVKNGRRSSGGNKSYSSDGP
ncbi:hypothetical protein AU381_19070 [Sinorhizobium glycinis]|uniref:Uncharacterized protein n=1 Tax=Sinorhizobium glycinis TaxID=1472378 RepID=A0A178XN18_9HYPH|nr:hypothetical protein AU381_19070 [Sinorhizobium glycinis]